MWTFAIKQWVKEQTDIVKDQYKLFEDQINVG